MLLRLGVGAVLGAGGLWLTLRDIPSGALRDVLVRIDPVLGVMALASTLVALVAVVVRWRILLGPEAPPLTLLFRATVISQMLNILLPLRAGEVVRGWAASAKGRVSVMNAAGSLAVEKAIDLTVFGLSTAALTLLAVVPAGPLQRTRWIYLPLLAGVGLVAAIVGARWVGTGGADDSPGRLPTLRRGFAATVAMLSRPRTLTTVLALSALVLSCSAAANQLLLIACGIDVPWWAGLAILVVLQAGTVPPALPGRIGVYNYLTVLTLGALGVDAAPAAGYSVALYAIAYLPKLLLGGVFLADPAWRPATVGSLHG